MDSGCILLDNFKEKRYWDIGNSIGLGSNKYFIGYDPSLNINSNLDFSLDNLLNFDCIVIGNKLDLLDTTILNQYKQNKEIIEF